jgi:hypothetical protein
MAAPDANDAWQLRFLHLAAGEAEALAWLTPFPHLFLPLLLEEKLDAAKRYLARWDGFRGEDVKSHVLRRPMMRPLPVDEIRSSAFGTAR